MSCAAPVVAAAALTTPTHGPNATNKGPLRHLSMNQHASRLSHESRFFLVDGCEVGRLGEDDVGTRSLNDHWNRR